MIGLGRSFGPLRASALRAGLLLSLVSASGCALLSKSEPLEWRYFEVPDAPGYQGSGGEQSAQRLRLGLVKAARHLDLRIVTRTSRDELKYYEDLRWTSEPDEFVRRSLSRNLYEKAGLSRVVSGVAPTLEVELTAFEEVNDGQKRRARVVLQTVLHDDRVQLGQHTVEVESEVDSGDGDEAQALVAALGRALAKATTQVTEQTLKSLSELSARTPPPLESAPPLPPATP